MRDVLLTSGVCFILVYASSVGDVVYFTGQVVTIILSGTIIGQVLWYRFLKPKRAGTKRNG